MRRSILALAAASLLLTEPVALAAPTCQNCNGVTVRCATPGAMPVGWTLPPEERVPLPASQNLMELLELVCVLGVFFSLMALLPDFERWRDDEEAK